MTHSSLMRKEKPDFKFGSMGNSNYRWVFKEGNGTIRWLQFTRSVDWLMRTKTICADDLDFKPALFGWL